MPSSRSPAAGWCRRRSWRANSAFASSIPSASPATTTTKQGDLKVLKGVSADVAKLGGGTGKGLLIVDDLVDTGKTGRLVRDMMPDAHFATVYAKPQGRPLVDTFITEVSQDTWIYLSLGYRAVVPAADPSVTARRDLRRHSGAMRSDRTAESRDSGSGAIAPSRNDGGERIEPPHAPAKPRHAHRRHHRHPASRPVHRQPRHHPRSRDQDAAEKALVEPGLDHLRLRVPGLAAQGDGRRGAGPSCSFSTRRPRSRPAIAPASSAAATTPTGFARRGRRAMALRTFARARSTRCCIGERLERGKKRLHPLPMPVAQLPDGAMVQQGEESFLIVQGRALRWSMAGYQRGRRRNRQRDAADAAVDAARAECGISAGAASECVIELSDALSRRHARA